MLAEVLMNIYVVGLNQIYDISIDKVNKPYLPLASGEFSMVTAACLVISSAIMSFSIGILLGSKPLLWALAISFIAGTIYSVKLPYLRWKRWPILAASCIICVRAFVIQICFYFHIQVYVLERERKLTKQIVFATLFMFVFSTVISIFKDIPDVEGDQAFGIQSLPARWGQTQMFRLCIGMLQLAYLAAIFFGPKSPILWRNMATMIGHVGLASLLFFTAQKVDLSDSASIMECYMLIWKLFYVEYLLIPLTQ